MTRAKRWGEGQNARMTQNKRITRTNSLWSAGIARACAMTTAAEGMSRMTDNFGPNQHVTRSLSSFIPNALSYLFQQEIERETVKKRT